MGKATTHQAQDDPRNDEILIRANGTLKPGAWSVMRDVHGVVNTTNACNVFIVRKGAVWISTGAYCMTGLTRGKGIAQCRAHDFPVHERNFSHADTSGADEAFLTRTFGTQRPVSEIDGRRIGTGEMGPVPKRIRQLYREIVSP